MPSPGDGDGASGGGSEAGGAPKRRGPGSLVIGEDLELGHSSEGGSDDEGGSEESGSSYGEEESEEESEEEWEETEEEDEGEPLYFGEDEVEEDDGEDDEGTETEEASEVSDITNETDASDDFQPPRPQQQYAQVMPEPPWSGYLNPCFRCLVACSLPLLLGCFSIFAVFKCLVIIGHIVLDIWRITKRLAWCAIRLALAPLYIVWRLLLPRVLRQLLYDEYERRIGVHLRRLLDAKQSVDESLDDLPNITLACGLAAIDTCVRPVKDHGSSTCWFYVGRHMDEWVLKPLQDLHLNRTTARRRRRAEESRRNPRRTADGTSMVSSQRARARRDRLKRLRAKRRGRTLEVTLAVPMGEAGHGTKVQVPSKTRSQIVSRTMVVERRYAVLVGVAWFLLGLTWLVYVLDGAYEERCLICTDYPDLGVQVCRHGQGQDCAFQQHQDLIVGMVGVMSVGFTLLVYSICLYKPRNTRARKDEEMKKQLELEEEDMKSATRKKIKEQEEMQQKEVVSRFQRLRSCLRRCCRRRRRPPKEQGGEEERVRGRCRCLRRCMRPVTGPIGRNKLVRKTSSMLGVTASTPGASRSVGGGSHRTARAGAPTLEDTLRRFGLDDDAREQAAAEKKAAEEAEEEEARKRTAQGPSGVEDSQLEVGDESAVLELEPELRARTWAEREPDEEDEEMSTARSWTARSGMLAASSMRSARSASMQKTGSAMRTTGSATRTAGSSAAAGSSRELAASPGEGRPQRSSASEESPESGASGSGSGSAEPSVDEDDDASDSEGSEYGEP